MRKCPRGRDNGMHSQKRVLDTADSQRPRSTQTNDLHPTVLHAAASRRGTMGGHWVLDLQRVIGNAAVAATLQDDEQSPVHQALPDLAHVCWFAGGASC